MYSKNIGLIMAYQEIILLCLVGLAAYCDGHTFKFGACPHVKVMKDFDMDLFVGEWFVVGRYNPVSTCTKVVIDKTPEGLYTAKETYRPFGISWGPGGENRRPRKLIMLRNDTDSIFTVRQMFPSIGLSTFGVVDTDYENYGLVWGCDNLLFGTVRNLDILSRNPDVTMDFIKQVAEKAENGGTDIEPLQRVDQSKCDKSFDIIGRSNTYNNMFIE